MSEMFDHDLIGYLLDALEPSEREHVEAALAADAGLRDRLDALRRGLGPLEDETHFEPPEGLADRTCAFVAAHANDLVEADSVATPRPSVRKSAREPLAPPARSWRGVDMAVALAICVAGLALVLPLINTSRANSQVAICANKLREIGLALTGYSERNGGLFPQVPESGNLSAAGVYAPTLIDAGFLKDSRLVICPGSPLAERANFSIPRLDEIRNADRQHLAELRRVMGGSYAYVLGYRDNGKLRPTRNLNRERFAVAADVPADDLADSPNHGRGGHNVLLEDGHVVYLRACRLDGTCDDIFLNDLGQVAPGCQINDSVVARSDVSP